MVKKLQHTVLLLLLLTLATMANAQNAVSVEVQAWANVRLATTYSGWDAGRNGGGIAAGVVKPLNSNFRAMGSVELGAAGIGNYWAGKAGIDMPVGLGASRWAYIPGFNVIQGMEFARPRPLYMWGIEQTNAMDLRLKNGSGPGIVIGFMLYGFPGYSRYSKVNSFFDLRAGLRYTF